MLHTEHLSLEQFLYQIQGNTAAGSLCFLKGLHTQIGKDSRFLVSQNVQEQE